MTINFKYIIFFFLFFSLVAVACDNQFKTKAHSNREKIDSVKDKVAKEVESIKFEDSIILIKLEEPDIETYNKEVFRFIRWIPYEKKIYIRVEQLEDSTFQMTSRYFVPFVSNHEFPSTSIPYKSVFMGDYIKGRTDTFMFFTAKQILDKQDWMTFKKILNGSYYWSFMNPYDEHKGLLDPQYLRLESKSIFPTNLNNDTLVYHVNYVAIPMQGSFSEAYQFLARKSILPQKLGIQSFEIDERLFPNH